MKFNLKSILKSFKLNESTISMILGTVVIVSVGVLIANYFKDKSTKGTLPEGTNNQVEVTNNGFVGKTHTVLKGENLWVIAEKEIGSGYNWVDLAKENNLKNPGLIFEGQKLAIPSIEPKLAIQPLTINNAISGATYQVVKGDNLWQIAVRAYGDGYKYVGIARENKLAHPSLIHPGNILALPR